MGYHAVLSASGAYRWAECSASVDAQRGRPDSTNPDSRMGTCNHQICAEVLGSGAVLDDYLGREMYFIRREEYWREAWPHKYLPEHSHEVDETDIEYCAIAIAYVEERVMLTGGLLEVEQRVPIGHFTGEGNVWINPATGDHVPAGTPGAEFIPVAGGTSDVVLVYDDTLETIDFKFGRHKVDAFDVLEPARGGKPPKTRINLQLACYLLGALEKFDWMANFKFFKATIVQPALNHISEYSGTIEELLEVREFLRAAAERTRTAPEFKPSFKTCHYCKASGDCAAQTAMALEHALDGFGDVDGAPVPCTAKPVALHKLGDLYAVTEFVRDWAKAVEDRVYEALDAGTPVVRSDGLQYFFVEGRKGNRKWDDQAEVEKTLSHYRLRKDEIYTFRLKSPAQIETLCKQKRGGPPPSLNKKQWETLQSRITQAPPGRSIALETDTRPRVSAGADGFVDVPQEGDDLGL